MYPSTGASRSLSGGSMKTRAAARSTGHDSAMDGPHRGWQDGRAGVWRLDRFARNVDGLIGDMERVEAADAHLGVVEEQIDPTRPFGRFLLTVLLAVATLERDNAVAGFEEAKRRAIARGAYIARTPWGYERQHDGTHPQGLVLRTRMIPH
jgi:hypothetical protein